MVTTSYAANPPDSTLVALLADAVGTSFTRAQVAAAGLSLDPAVLRRLLRRGSVVRIGRGRYFIPEVPVAHVDDQLRIATAPFDGEPHYVSWWAALARHGMTEQDPLTIGVAVRVRRHRTQMLGSIRVRPVAQSQARFYGATTLATQSGPVRIASPEKAIVDSLDRPDLAGGLGEVVKALVSGAFDVGRLLAVARRYPSRATAARLGYLLETLEVADASDLLPRVRRKSEPVRLDVSADAAGPIDPRWRIAQNTPADKLRYLASA